jgi:hypothetical protein
MTISIYMSIQMVMYISGVTLPVLAFYYVGALSDPYSLVKALLCRIPCYLKARLYMCTNSYTNLLGVIND